MCLILTAGDVGDAGDAGSWCFAGPFPQAQDVFYFYYYALTDVEMECLISQSALSRFLRL